MYELPHKNRIIVLGDIHGDYDLLIKMLKMGQVIDDNNNWIGNDTVVIQLGDQIDSERKGVDKGLRVSNTNYLLSNDIKILEFMTELHNKALKHDGAVYSLLGNHEILNVQGYFNYVSKNDMYEGRKEDFKPNGKMAKFLAHNRYSALKIGDYLFVHGGIISKYAKKYSIKFINEAVKKWLLGKKISKNIYNDLIDVPTQDYNSLGPFWNRLYSTNNSVACDDFNIVKEIYKVDKIFIAHTPQLNNGFGLGVNSSCNDNIWKLDVGASYGFDINDDKTNNLNTSRKPQILVIENGKFEIRKALKWARSKKLSIMDLDDEQYDNSGEYKVVK